MEYDLAIIGGGIIGSMVAGLATIKFPGISIALIDKKLIGSGTTFYSAGLSIALAKNAMSKEFIINRPEIIYQIKSHVDLNLHPLSIIYVVSTESLEKFHTLYVGNNLIEISQNDYPSIFWKNLKLKKNMHFFLSKEKAHYCNPSEISSQLSTFLRKNSQAVFESSEVTNIEYKDTYNHIEINNQYFIKAKKTVLAMGPWVNQYNFSARNTDSKNKKVAALHLKQIPENDDPAIIFFDDDAFLLPLYKNGLWLFSFSSNEWNCNPNNKFEISASDLASAHDLLRSYSDNLVHLINGGRVFCDSYTVNKEILINPINPITFLIDGASGSGYHFSYGVAEKILKELI
jgi:hypothetical protein